MTKGSPSCIEGGEAMDVGQFVELGPVRAILLCAIACAVRLAAYTREITVGLVIRRFIISIGLGYLAFELFASLEISEQLRYSLLIFVALWADDILMFIMDFGKRFRRNPAAAISSLKRLIGKR